MSYIGTNKIGKMYLGDTEIAKVYLGSNLVYQNIHYAISSGIAPLTFQAKSGDIRSLIQYGKCEQRNNLPPGCVEVEYLESTGTQYIDTGINTTETISYDIVCAFLENDINLMGAIYNPSGSTYNRVNFGVYSGFKIYYGRTSPSAWTSQSYDNSFHRFRQLISREDVTVYFDDVEYNSFTRQTYNLNLNFWIFARNSNIERLKIYCSCRIKSAKLQNEDNVVLIDMIPVRVGTVGYMYDRVSGQLFGNSGTGDFVLGPDVVPTPDKPIDIWCNNGVIKARHQSGLPLGYTKIDYLQNDINSYIYTNIGITADFKVLLDLYIPNSYSNAKNFIAGKTNANSFTITGYSDNVLASRIGTQSTSGGIVYTLSTRGVIGLSTHGKKHMNSDTWIILERPISDADTLKLFGNAIFRLYEAIIYDGDVLLADFIPAKNSSNVIGLYDLVSKQFFTNDGTGDFIAGNEVSDPIEIYTDDTPEVLTISATGQSTQTATAKNLLQVGNYKDTQDILSGSITRKVGILILNGTEKWGGSSSANFFSLRKSNISPTPLADIGDVFCTHFLNSHDYSTNAGTVFLGVSYLNINYDNTGGNSSSQAMSAFKQWLADQYAAGTPVIVIYPLATETTESVTAQHLTTTSGENTIDVTANVSDINVEVECLT